MDTSKAKSVIYAEMRKHTGDLADALKVAHKALCHVEKEELRMKKMPGKQKARSQ